MREIVCAWLCHRFDVAGLLSAVGGGIERAIEYQTLKGGEFPRDEWIRATIAVYKARNEIMEDAGKRATAELSGTV